MTTFSLSLLTVLILVTPPSMPLLLHTLDAGRRFLGWFPYPWPRDVHSCKGNDRQICHLFCDEIECLILFTSSFARFSYSECGLRSLQLLWVWLTLASLAHSHGRDESVNLVDVVKSTCTLYAARIEYHTVAMKIDYMYTEKYPDPNVVTVAL